MYGFSHSKHSIVRSQQRGVRRLIIELLFNYGESRQCRDGVEGLFFTRESLREILNDLGSQIFKICEKFRNAYLIVSDEGVLITVARGYRTVH